MQKCQDIVDVYSLDGGEESIDSSELEEFPKNRHQRIMFSKEIKVKEEPTKAVKKELTEDQKELKCFPKKVHRYCYCLHY